MNAIRQLTTENAIACEQMKGPDVSSEVLVLETFPREEIKCGRMYDFSTLAMIKEAAEGWTPTREQISSQSWTVIRYFG